MRSTDKSLQVTAVGYPDTRLDAQNSETEHSACLETYDTTNK